MYVLIPMIFGIFVYYHNIFRNLNILLFSGTLLQEEILLILGNSDICFYVKTNFSFRLYEQVNFYSCECARQNNRE